MSDSEVRPDPEAILKRIHSEATRERRAKLRVYLGYAPGVGKTFAMLSAARELRTKDVVIGIVETHGRYDTAALVLGLELLPRRIVEYRGRKLEEFDLDAALARKPKVLLVDELAHTNAPGSRHGKRWQDVLDLLDAGIDVHTTVNIQHIESLNDVIAQITSVRVRETVPDSILSRADEIELVDVPPEELATRLREGKVYLTEQAARAVDHFFRRGNLLALRELALRRVADHVDRDVLAHREEHGVTTTWPTKERILVCVGPAPASARLVRAAARIAAGLRAPWVAAYVEPTTVEPMTDAQRERLSAHLRLAESLGAEVVRLSGGRISVALVDYSSRHNVTRIVIGKPTHSRLRDLIKGSLLDEVVRGSGDIDVNVISGDVDASPGEASSKPIRKPAESELEQYAWAVGLVGVATMISWALRGTLALPDMVAIYLLVIMVVATRFGRGPSVAAALLSVASYDFFSVPPYFTFAVSDVRHILTFALMLGVGLLISGLTVRIRRGEQEARAREEQTAALYALSRELGTALDEDDVALAIVRNASSVFESGAGVLLSGDSPPNTLAAKEGDVPFDAQEQAVARWVLEHERAAGLGTETLPGSRVTCLPLQVGASTLGVLALSPRGRNVALSGDRHFTDAYLRQGAMAIERVRLAESAKAAVLRARTEEMRSSLLSAVSHDLRTPLAVITGSATTLRAASAKLPEKEREELLDTVCEEAERLERLVANLLDMTRLESGGLKVKREWVPLEELVASALSRTETKLSGRPVATDLPDDLPLLSVDPVSFEQVLINLLENVAKYTPPGTPVELTARQTNDGCSIEVADRGPGIPAQSLEQVFEKFYRGPSANVTGGVGLGLAICRGIVEAHGGKIIVENREGGGAAFRITLPRTGDAPPMLPDSDVPREASANI